MLLFTLALISMISACSPRGEDVAPSERRVFLSDLVQPIDLAFHPEGELLVALKAGEILRVSPDDDPAAPVSYLSLDDVDNAGERGLISFALSPVFAEDPWVYVYYSKASRSRFRVSRFMEREGRLVPGSEELIWENPRAYTAGVHFGGDICFGPDGRLFFTTGNEGQESFPRDLSKAQGKVFRLELDGSIPPDNPWRDGSGPNLDGLWACGLRNPFRAYWDLPTKRFLIAEVGGNNHLIAWEDLHLGKAGADYGWPPCEGPCESPLSSHCDCDTHEAPIWSYHHGGDGAAFVGGFVYRGGRVPESLQGAYICGDYVQGWIKYLRFESDEVTVKDSGFILRDAGLVVALVQGPDDAIYYADLMGSVRRLRFPSP